jgi:drug/metabolite transporter (DMT)-like permease
MRRQALLAAALFFIYVIWESSYAAIQACLVEIPVFALTASRLLVSGVMLVVIARRSKEPRFTPREFLGAALVGIVLIWATSTALAIGLSDTDAGLASVILATVPVLSGLGGLLFGQHFKPQQWFGTMVGLIGLLGILQIGDSSSHGLLWVLTAAVAAALGSLLGHLLPTPRGLLSATSVQFLFAGLLAAWCSWFSGETLAFPTLQVALVWTYFTLVVTLGGYIAYFWLLRQHGLLAANSYAYVNPVIAMALSALIYGVAPGLIELVSSSLVLAGAVFALHGSASSRSRH